MSSHYSNTTVDKLLDEGARHDRSRRSGARLYAADLARAAATICRSPICTITRNIVAMTAKLNGFRPVPDGMIRIQGLEMAK